MYFGHLQGIQRAPTAYLVHHLSLPHETKPPCLFDLLVSLWIYGTFCKWKGLFPACCAKESCSTQRGKHNSLGPVWPCITVVP